MVPLNYNQLYYFYQIAESGSIAKASKIVLISSPALSMQLKELEESLGTSLFERSGNKLLLTEAGTIVHEYARDIFKLGFELKDTLGDRKKGHGKIKIEIGCQDTLPKKVSDELLSFLIQNNARVILREGTKSELLNLQNDYKLDLILINSMPEMKDNFYETKLLAKEEISFFAHPKYKNLRAKFPLSLENVPLILSTYESSSRQKIDKFFNDKKITPDVIAEVEDKATEIDLALKGFGVIASMKKAVKQELENKSLIEIGVMKNTFEEIWMVTGKRKILNPAALSALKNFTLKWD